MTTKPLPATLLQLSGALPAPSKPEESVLVLIDAQREYTEGKVPLTHIDAAIAEAARLLAFARAHAVPVIHVVHQSKPGAALFDPETVFAEIVVPLRPLAGETIVTKTLPSSFAGTDLGVVLERTGRKGLWLAGFMTHMCVSTTARAALDLGYKSTVIAAATATRDLPGIDGTVIPAEVVHNVALAELADRFATVVKDTEALSSLVS